MKSDFKVLDWVRRVRDRNAGEERNMSVEERSVRLRERAEPLVETFLANHPRARRTPSAKNACVREEAVRYRRRRR
jgi:hypothetical protein